MTRLAWLVALSGCSLYFKPSPINEDDAPPDGGVQLPQPDGSVAIVRCEDGALREVHVQPFTVDMPRHGSGDPVGHCAAECRSASFVCAGDDCGGAVTALCEAAPSTGAACDIAGTACDGSGSIECPFATTCGDSVAGATCACNGSTYDCAPRDQPAIQQGIVGKWQGTVHAPSFSLDYAVTMWIYPDGSYWAECDTGSCTAFYYGGDGPYPDRKLTILASDPMHGASADIGIYFGTSPANTGAIEALTASDTALRFTFYASWFGCAEPFTFDLTRE